MTKKGPEDMDKESQKNRTDSKRTSTEKKKMRAAGEQAKIKNKAKIRNIKSSLYAEDRKENPIKKRKNRNRESPNRSGENNDLSSHTKQHKQSQRKKAKRRKHNTNDSSKSEIRKENTILLVCKTTWFGMWRTKLT